MSRLFLVLALFAALATVRAPRFWGALVPGQYDVGFEIVEGSSAPGSAGWKPRPIVISVWYPSVRNPETPRMTFGDYFDLAEDLRRRSPSLSVAIAGDPSAISEETQDAIRRSPMRAQRGAQRAAGEFPIALFAARYGTVAAQSVLAEYLASHGFVVAAVRPQTDAEKLPFEAKTDADKVEELDAQTDDLRGALRIVRGLPSTRDEPSAVIAWSYGGESAWRLSQSDSRVTLVIGLDTNVRANWVYQREKLAAIGDVPSSARFVDLNKGSGEFADLAHGNFNALEGMIPAVMGIERVQRWSKSGAAAKAGYEAIARRVLSELARMPRVASPFETVRFAAADGLEITAEVFRAKSGRRCAALFHQSGSSRGEYRTIAAELARRGFTSVAADVRWGNRDRWNDVVNETAARYGTPSLYAAFEKGDRGALAKMRASEHLDLEATVDWMKRNGCDAPVIVWGSSIGANGVFELAARRPADVAAIVDASPGEYMRDEPNRMKTIVAKIDKPSLVVWGRHEEDLSKPVFDAVAGPKLGYQSTGRHGNAVFFEDGVAWTHLREFLESLPK